MGWDVTYRSLNQLSKSESLQRGEQNGRGGKSDGASSITFLHVGHTIRMTINLARPEPS